MQPSSGTVPVITRQRLLSAGAYDLVACETYLASRRIRIPLDDGRGGVTHVSCWPPRPAVGPLSRHPTITIIRIDPCNTDDAGQVASYYALIRRPDAADAHPLSGMHVRTDTDVPVSARAGTILIGDMTVDVSPRTAT